MAEIDQDPNAPIVITNFNGQAENPHIGAGVNVGLDLYTTKEVARLSRRMIKKSGSVVTQLPLYVTEDNNGYIYAQGDGGVIYISLDQGNTWNILSGNSGGNGEGIMVWENFLFSATPSSIDVYNIIGGTWTNNWWISNASQPALDSTVGAQHVMYINPALNFLYICNGRYIAYVQLATPTAVFNPTNNATYLASDKAFIMTDYYIAQTMAFLPPASTAIAVANKLNNSQADIVIWNGLTNTTATNVVSVPGATGPIKQMITKNGVLYGITDREHGIYIINGSSAQNVDRLGLRMSNRKITGEEYTTRVTSFIYPNAIDFLGPELLTGGANFPSPVTQISGTGLYPFGVWSINIENKIVGVRFPLSFGDINAQYGTSYVISFIKVLDAGKVLVGWGKSNTYGIDVLSPDEYITDKSTVFIESALYEVGTRTLPRTFSQIEYNLIQTLKTGEEIDFYYRTRLDQPYLLFHSETPATLGNNISDIITPLPWQASQYIQIGVQYNASSSSPTLTPQFRSIILR